MPTVNLGRVKPIHRGEYSALTEYRPLDIVTYNNNTYFCIATSTGNLPTDTDYFEPIVDVNFGTIATQDADNVAITGGTSEGVAHTDSTINNTPIGQDTPAPGDFSTLAIGGDPVAPATVGSTFATVGGTANDLTLTTDPAITPVEGTELRFKLTNTNTGASTVAINGGAAMDIETVTGAATPAGYLTADEWVTGIVTGGKLRVFWATPRTGSNANGEWAQWDNGRMECQYHGDVDKVSLSYPRDMPVTFTSLPVVGGASHMYFTDRRNRPLLISCGAYGGSPGTTVSTWDFIGKLTQNSDSGAVSASTLLYCTYWARGYWYE